MGRIHPGSNLTRTHAESGAGQLVETSKNREKNLLEPLFLLRRGLKPKTSNVFQQVPTVFRRTPGSPSP